MIISSLTLTAVTLACASFCVVRGSNTSEQPPATSSTRKSVHHHAHPETRIRNFIATDNLYDGEQERRIHFNGITAKETTATAGASGIVGRQSVKLRQATDGVHFIQMIYAGADQLTDCEFIRQKKAVHDFLSTFRADVERAKLKAEDLTTTTTTMTAEDGTLVPQLRNVTFRVLEDGEPLPQDIASWLDYTTLQRQCRKNHREMRRLVRQQQHGSEEEKRHAQDHLERAKRGISEVFIAPGTKWCGTKHLASRYTELGTLSSTDRCCRRHDHCHFSIPAFTTKYGIFNFRPFTVSHCNCDRSFRTCLKMAGTGPANLVGNVFFNIVQTKCFVLKPQKVCLKHSWWGKCEKQGYKKQAHLRDNIPY